jgi:hypothetical protein
MSVYGEVNNNDGGLNQFMNEAAPVNYNMSQGVLGSYGGIKFKTPCKDGWRKPPCVEKVKKGNFWVPQGTPLPLKNEVFYSELPEDSMFVFARNYVSPDCCPATYSTDRGCVCTTSAQRKLIGQTRGNNKNFPNYSF